MNRGEEIFFELFAEEIGDAVFKISRSYLISLLTTALASNSKEVAKVFQDEEAKVVFRRMESCSTYEALLNDIYRNGSSFYLETDHHVNYFRICDNLAPLLPKMRLGKKLLATMYETVELRARNPIYQDIYWVNAIPDPQYLI